MTANQIAYNRHIEERRHNRVSERHEHYDTRSRRMQAEAASSQAATAEKQVGVNWWLAQESKRASLAKEAETYRHNYQTEELDRYKSMTAAAAAQDQARAALQQASTARVNAVTRQSELAETIRRNSAAIAQAQSELSESKRRNLAQEAISRSSVAETTRSNLAAEALKGLQLEEQTRHNIEQEKVATSGALTASRQASVAEQNAATNIYQANIAQQRADAEDKRVRNDTVRTVIGGVESGVGVAKDIVKTVGGFFK